MSEKQPLAWIEALYTSRWTEILLRITKQKYSRLADVEGLMEEGRQELCINLDKRAKNPDQSEGTLSDAYIVTSYKTAMTDILRKRNGRPTPKKWLLAHGVIGKLLFEYVCLLQMKLSEILMAKDSSMTPDPLIESAPRDMLIYLYNEIERRRECEPWERTEVSIHADEHHDSLGIDPADENHSDKQHIEEIIHLLLYGGLSSDRTQLKFLAQQITACRKLLGGKFDLSDEQRFILTAFHLNNLEDKETAKFLGIDVRQVRYQRGLAMEKLEKTIRLCGDLSWDSLFD